MSRDFIYPVAAWPPKIALDGQVLRFVPITTPKLLLYVANDAWSYLIPDGLEEGQRVEIYARLRDPQDTLTLARLQAVSHQVMESVCGTRFSAARQILQRTLGNWFFFDGWCIHKGFDPNTAPVHRIVSAGYQWWVETGVDPAKKNELTQLNNKLWPPDEEKSSREERAIMAQVTANMGVGDIAR